MLLIHRVGYLIPSQAFRKVSWMRQHLGWGFNSEGFPECRVEGPTGVREKRVFKTSRLTEKFILLHEDGGVQILTSESNGEEYGLNFGGNGMQEKRPLAALGGDAAVSERA